MGIIKKLDKSKLIVGFIYKDDAILEKVEDLLAKRFGPIDKISPTFLFTHTKYYEKEMGDNLKRKFISFERLIAPEKIWIIKLLSNKLETRFSSNENRTINIDPGYLNLSKVVLLTTKDYTHRIYLGRGIFAEVTLAFKDNSFRPLDHTYPDYRSAEYIGLFNAIRETYKSQIM
ncbi:MAG: DUF4416 domain-containing protein [Candidatus Omnitrophica bacterium CG07_land_8_20_14_0_80_42_15]|uniref:DUF4416 domain-containing protein n=1 Tax=Candidatus Aquitaenariimonas noxiae TaxID=1974741 RepID=A0A2J0KTY8_9BACT|nr:MAG: DUF4416 domain-containing protein [Candidatus Omnitrophica bacterium CG07_land_8_20_14_0_80_42_15]